MPNAQRTVGFEKGSILFNIGALHTQIACRQVNRTRLLILKINILPFSSYMYVPYYFFLLVRSTVPVP